MSTHDHKPPTIKRSDLYSFITISQEAGWLDYPRLDLFNEDALVIKIPKDADLTKENRELLTQLVKFTVWKESTEFTEQNPQPQPPAIKLDVYMVEVLSCRSVRRRKPGEISSHAIEKYWQVEIRYLSVKEG